MNFNSANSKGIQSRSLKKAVGPEVGPILRLLLDGQKVRLHSAVKILSTHINFSEQVVEPGSNGRGVNSYSQGQATQFASLARDTSVTHCTDSLNVRLNHVFYPNRYLIMAAGQYPI